MRVFTNFSRFDDVPLLVLYQRFLPDCSYSSQRRTFAI
ncbi:hypothetical protein PTUN_b0279 [Pseudoalteromonas tunicata]|nr:hypothetical protein PTUN_b0279 [Pseudoalteromonas tunicata]